MPETIISDTSCLIILNNIGELELLPKIYGRIITTSEVANEYGELLPEWIEIKSVKDKNKQKIFENEVDKGEASAIALAIETPQSTIILDDYKARRLAKELGLTITGTIWIIVRAKVLGFIPSVKNVFEKMRQTNFRFSEEIERQALRDAGEYFWNKKYSF